MGWKRLKQDLKPEDFRKEVTQIDCQRQGVRTGSVLCVCVHYTHMCTLVRDSDIVFWPQEMGEWRACMCVVIWAREKFC